MAARLDELMERLGHRFSDMSVLIEALTHPSVERPARERRLDYDRLEFLGDRVLGLIIANRLYRIFPAADAGELARRYNAMVRRESLAQVAETLGIGAYLRMSRSERAAGGGGKAAILADACEALIAALWLDGGLSAAESFVLRSWEPLFATMAGAEKDAKTALQEWAHANGRTPPRYDLLAQTGPAHEPVFTISVTVGISESATASGRSKREAEQAAAQLLLAELLDSQPRDRNV